MMEPIIIFLASGFATFLLLYFLLKLKIRAMEKENQEIIEKLKLHYESQERVAERREVLELDREIKDELDRYKEKRIQEIEDDVKSIMTQKELELEFTEKTILKTIAEIEEFADEIFELKMKEVGEASDKLQDFRSRLAAVNEAILREKEKEEKENFYRIVLSPSDKEDIIKLSEIRPRLNNKSALDKLLFDVFIKRPLGEMTKRITGGKSISGVYKITYIPTGESYIGKSVDINKRWTDHVKNAFGVGTIARSSLHVKMAEKGVDNFYFEIIEEVPRESLTEREKYYIDLYGTMSQLNMKRG